jgi:YHS domain-containing protein
MKKIGIFFLLISFSALGQKYNIKKGFIAEGYDVVAYFNNTSIKGDKKFTSEFKGVPFKFSSKENLVTFDKSPQRYVPQYGGFCAYAIGVRGEKVAINPKNL